MKKITGIKAISFDADGTLWDFDKVMRRSLGLTLKELKSHDSLAASRLDINKMVEIRNRVAAGLKGKITNLEEVRLAAFKQTLAETGRPDDALAFHLNDFYLKHRFEDIELFDDVLPALRVLRTKYIIGLVSNGNSYPERCGLDGIFHFVVFSQDYGIEKPDPRIFLIAAEKAGCSPGEIVNVGDSLDNDVAGAVNAGLRAVWLNRLQKTADPAMNIEVEISSLSELPDIL
jgi:FMN hydrolase / 5-amino-6-(5-phospho-D-ribitylamino)uracil phosphatase